VLSVLSVLRVQPGLCARPGLRGRLPLRVSALPRAPAVPTALRRVWRRLRSRAAALRGPGAALRFVAVGQRPWATPCFAQRWAPQWAIAPTRAQSLGLSPPPALPKMAPLVLRVTQLARTRLVLRMTRARWAPRVPRVLPQLRVRMELELPLEL
jgi:hypothetical protein